MTPDERSDDDLIASLLCDRVRDLEDHLAKERRMKSEVLGRLDRVTQDKHSLETRVALLEAELKRARQTSPVESREIRAPFMDAFGGVA